MKAHFATFARYNAWANAKLLDAAAIVGEDGFAADGGAVFGSLRGTLNHLLVGDRMWLRRITGTGPEHTRLDEVPYPLLADFRSARDGEDVRIVAIVDALTGDDLAAALTYRTTSGGLSRQPLAQVLAHLFNHQTHHRGQAHVLLTRLGQPSVEMDLIYFLRQASGAA